MASEKGEAPRAPRVFDRDWLAARRAQLEARRRELEEQIGSLRRSLAAEAQYQEEEGTVATHPADEATELFGAEVDLTLLRELQEERSLVEAALERIERGTYGICVDCGQPIERERLETIPWAERCIRDQERFEAQLANRRP